MDYILTSNGELYHYGVKGMKWGVRRKKRDENDVSEKRDRRTKKPLTTGQKVAIGAAVTAGILATAYGSYTVSKAYGRQYARGIKDAKQMAKSMASATKFEQETLNRPAFDQKKYDEYFKEFRSESVRKLLKKPVGEIVKPELKKQGDLIKGISRSVRKRVAPSPFDVIAPESFQKIIERYNA